MKTPEEIKAYITENKAKLKKQIDDKNKEIFNARQISKDADVKHLLLEVTKRRAQWDMLVHLGEWIG